MKAKARVHEVNSLARKQPPVEGTGHSHHVVGQKPLPSLLPLRREGSEEGVEVVSREVVQQQLDLRGPAAQPVAALADSVHYRRKVHECVGPRGAAQIRDHEVLR